MKENDPNTNETTLSSLEDRELMRRYQLGDERAFCILYERHAPKVFGFIKKRIQNQSIAEDLFQSTFLKLHNSRHAYNSKLPFLPWLFTITQNVMIDGIRKQKRIKEIVDPTKLGLATAKEDNEPTTVPDISKLPDRQKRAMELRYKNELSFDAIAKELNTSPSNVRQLISRGIKNLKRYGAGL